MLDAHLAEMDTRDVYLREGYPSLFVYCREVLSLSEAEAGNRIVAARAARRFPVILEMLASGVVNLTAVRLLAPHLTADNHRDVPVAARGQSKLEVEEIVARLAPRPDVPPSIRRLPAPRPDPAPSLAGPRPAADVASLAAPPAEALPPLSLPVCPAELRPLSPDRKRAVWVRDVGRCKFIGTGGHRCNERRCQLVREPAMSYASGRLRLREHVLEHVAQLPRVKTGDLLMAAAPAERFDTRGLRVEGPVARGG